LAACSVSAQAVIVSAPKDPSLLTVTREWSRASSLGDLRAIHLNTSDIEVRAWGGYGLTSTEVMVLRRERGQWSARRARLVPCSIQVPIPVGDTASAATLRRFMADARRECGAVHGDVSRGARIVAADTLAVESLAVAEATIDSAWNGAVAAGLLRLPPRVERKWVMMDGFTYVIEVRQGKRYRAAVIEHVEHPEVAADSLVKKVYAALLSFSGTSRNARP
jgi:hypothetical protein